MERTKKQLCNGWTISTGRTAFYQSFHSDHLDKLPQIKRTIRCSIVNYYFNNGIEKLYFLVNM